MKMTFTNWIILGFIVLTVGAVGVKTYQNAGPGEYDEFAQCLTDENVAMYGSDTCPVCQRQKKLLGKSFEFINYIRCEENQELCSDEEITGYPTWKIHGETTTKIGSGFQTLEQLAAASSCELPEFEE